MHHCLLVPVLKADKMFRSRYGQVGRTAGLGNSTIAPNSRNRAAPIGAIGAIGVLGCALFAMHNLACGTVAIAYDVDAGLQGGAHRAVDAIDGGDFCRGFAAGDVLHS